MERDTADSGLELVIDNRKLILGFLALVVICGFFFVLGFVEGKRQVVPREAAAAAEPAPSPATDEGEAKSSVGNAIVGQADPAPSREPLDWYKSVNGDPPENRISELATKAGPPKTIGPAAKPEPAVIDAPKAPPKPQTTSVTTYAVQVGAFRQRKEAEIKASGLKAKGYEGVIEFPQSPDELFLVQVGRFNSRADAVAMQLRLRKDGFPTFIKTQAPGTGGPKPE